MDNAPAVCDVILVLAGRIERKPYGLKLFQQQLASRLIVSVSRHEVRQTAQQLSFSPLLELRDATPPNQRHFWIDCCGGQQHIVRAEGIRRSSTFWELHALARYLAPDIPQRIAIVSTSIHLRRVRLCCGKIPEFGGTDLLFLPVPESLSSFVKERWWQHLDHWSYVLSEFAKLTAYALLY
ncbi:MAG TPA: hypothetical protein VJV96_01665 [Candidatus Angelobacter sp.]|jgi:hypothetical protein|nr:hypothetical protein [Candidatus Angelobacter sp.]